MPRSCARRCPALFTGEFQVITEFGRSIMAKNGFIIGPGRVHQGHRRPAHRDHPCRRPGRHAHRVHARAVADPGQRARPGRAGPRPAPRSPRTSPAPAASPATSSPAAGRCRCWSPTTGSCCTTPAPITSRRRSSTTACRASPSTASSWTGERALRAVAPRGERGGSGGGDRAAAHLIGGHSLSLRAALEGKAPDEDIGPIPRHPPSTNADRDPRAPGRRGRCSHRGTARPRPGPAARQNDRSVRRCSSPQLGAPAAVAASPANQRPMVGGLEWAVARAVGEKAAPAGGYQRSGVAHCPRWPAPVSRPAPAGPKGQIPQQHGAHCQSLPSRRH